MKRNMFIVKKCWLVGKLYISSVYIYIDILYMTIYMTFIYTHTHTITKPRTNT